MEMYGNVLKCVKMFGNELKLSLSFLAIFSVFWLYGKCIENLMEHQWKCMEMYKMYRKIYETYIEICENLQKCIEMY